MVRLRARPAQVRIRLRIPARVLQAGPPGPVRTVLHGTVLPGAVLPGPGFPGPGFPGGAPTRLRIAFRRGVPVPARLVLPASLPGRARLHLQIPARARITPALPAPPDW
jgi:hypothetical protein